ncbi:MAG TPA: sulfite exporter TauE/SafE family protein [Burkholderiaceae bacterium]|nr:sulfite exporter TauE/SafE family protein [Burkholderiaceae bacterium]
MGVVLVVLQYVISGALVGLVVGATGVGGGSLMTPLLTLVFGVPAQVAVGTDLLFASITKSGGAWTYARHGQVRWPIVYWLALGSVPASCLTLAAVQQLHLDSVQFNALLRPILGLALLLTAAALAFRTQIQVLGARAIANAAPALVGNANSACLAASGTDRALRPAPTLALGALIGVLVTLTSVGAGAIGVVALFFLYPSLVARQLVAADIAHAVPLTLIAGLGHAALGTVDWAMLLALLLGSLPAIHLGARLSGRLPERVLRVFLASMLLLIGLRLLWI